MRSAAAGRMPTVLPRCGPALCPSETSLSLLPCSLPQGTLFVLQKEVSAKSRLLEALSSRQKDDDLIEQLAAEVQVRHRHWVIIEPDSGQAVEKGEESASSSPALFCAAEWLLPAHTGLTAGGGRRRGGACQQPGGSRHVAAGVDAAGCHRQPTPKGAGWSGRCALLLLVVRAVRCNDCSIHHCKTAGHHACCCAGPVCILCILRCPPSPNELNMPSNICRTPIHLIHRSTTGRSSAPMAGWRTGCSCCRACGCGRWRDAAPSPPPAVAPAPGLRLRR